MFTAFQACSSRRQLSVAAVTSALRVCQFMPVHVEPRLARVRCAWSSSAQQVLECEKERADWPRAGLLSRIHMSASMTARSRSSTIAPCSQCSRCSLSCGPIPHGHCTQFSFAADGMAAFRALLTRMCALVVGTTPAQMRTMAVRTAWDSQDCSMCRHIGHCDCRSVPASAFSVTHSCALPPHWPP